MVNTQKPCLSWLQGAHVNKTKTLPLWFLSFSNALCIYIPEHLLSVFSQPPVVQVESQNFPIVIKPLMTWVRKQDETYTL